MIISNTFQLYFVFVFAITRVCFVSFSQLAAPRYSPKSLRVNDQASALGCSFNRKKNERKTTSSEEEIAKCARDVITQTKTDKTHKPEWLKIEVFFKHLSH